MLNRRATLTVKICRTVVLIVLGDNVAHSTANTVYHKCLHTLKSFWKGRSNASNYHVIVHTIHEMQTGSLPHEQTMLCLNMRPPPLHRPPGNRRVRHCQHRKAFQETAALGATTAVAFGSTFGGNLNATGGGGGLGGGGGADRFGGTELFR